MCNMLYICIAFLIVHYLLTFNVKQKLKKLRLSPNLVKKKEKESNT